jgi:hypothetical protein
MRRLLVGCRGLDGAVGLDQQEPSGIVLLLQHVEPRDARLLQAVPRVLDASGLEGIHLIGFHLDVHMDDQHKTLTHLGEIEEDDDRRIADGGVVESWRFGLSQIKVERDVWDRGRPS